MSQLTGAGGGGGGGGITTIDGDVGFVSGSAVTFTGSGSGLTFTGNDSTTMTLVGTLNVSHGGTGFASTTAYGLIAGGTTSTATLQNAGTGTSGQVYVSGGAAALGTWTTLSGIAVTSITGTANQITASASTGAVILSIPSTFIAPGSITSTTTITAGTGLTVTSGGATITAGGLTVSAGTTSLVATTIVGTANINATGSAVTTIGTGGTGAVNIGNATGGTTFTGTTTLAAMTQAGTANINTSGSSNTNIGTNIGITTIGNTTNTTIIQGALSACRPIVTQSGGSYTLALTDANAFEYCTSASATTVTIPTNASVAFFIGTEIDFFQSGSGQVSFAASGGVTLNSYLSKVNISAQYAGASLKKVGTDTWILVGNLS